MAYTLYGEGSDAWLLITVDGWEVFTSTVDMIPEASRDWWAKRLDAAFQDSAKRSAKKGIAAHQQELQKLLGIS